MNELNRQVKRAQLRLNLFKLIYTLAWCCFATLLVAAVAVAIPKLWAIGIGGEIWFWSWVGGALAVGAIAAVACMYLSRFSSLDAAIEIDKRFGLKERVSSTLALNEQEQQTEIGQALVSDAVRRVERIDITEQFQYNGRWWNLLPVLPVAIVVVMLFFPDAQDPTKQAGANNVSAEQRIEKSTQALKKRVAALRKKAESKDAGLKTAEDALKELEKGIENLTKADSSTDKKKAMVKLNNLSDELKKRRDGLGDKEQLEKQLNQLSSMKQGPADRLARAMRDANFQKAMEEISKLQQELKDGKMSPENQQKLAEQMQQMAKKLQQAADAHDQAKRELEEKINQLKKQGQMAKAGALQKKLDKMNNQQRQMDKLRQMANNMQAAAKGMQEGQTKDAQQKLDQLAQDVQQMQQDMDELEMMNEALDEIALAKDAMNCEACGGAGCEQCMGDGMEFDEDPMPGEGLGKGRGVGDRPEAETDKDFYTSRVKGKVRKGQAVVVGTANGQNVAGQPRESIKDLLSAENADDADPLAGQQLTRAQKDHAQEYFEALGNQ